MPYKRGRKGKQQAGRTTPVPPPPSVPAATTSHSATTLDPAVTTATTTAAAPGTNHPPPQDWIFTSEKRRGVYECDYCHTDISQVPRIRCAVCPDFDLCLECFLTTDHAATSARLRAALATQQALQDEGTVVTQTTTATTAALHHDDTHGYRVCDSTRYPLFPTARQYGGVGGTGPSTTATSRAATSTTAASLASEQDNDNNNEEEEENGNGNDTTTKNNNDDNDIDDDDKEGATNSDDAMQVDTDDNDKKEATVNMTQHASLEDITATVLVDDPKTVWTAEEDLRLIQGIRAHGLGNWVEIADVVAGQGSTGKTPRRCMERYFDDFCGRYGHILPPYTLVMEDLDNNSPTEEGTTADDNNNNSNNNNNNNTAATSTNAADTEDSVPATPSNKAVSETSSTYVDATPRSSKRRAVLMRTPSGAASTQIAAGWTQRKRFKCVPTDSLPNVADKWQQTYLPHDGVQKGAEVGREAAFKAEQTYCRLLAATTTAEQAKQIHDEWRATRLLKPGGPTVLPPRLDDICAMPGSELVGFMPRRGDFDIEWENDAEQAVADMEFLPGEPPEDVALKLQVLNIYNSKLDEREKRKNFILSRKLWDYHKAQQQDAKLPQDERDLVHRMRLFERFHTPAEHAKFLQDILRAKRLRKEIAKLQMYRRMGIRTMAEAERYELDKQRRLTHRQFQAKESESNSTSNTKKDGEGSETASTTKTGLTEETTSTSLWKQYRTGERRNRKSINRGSPGTPPGTESTAPEGNNSEKPLSTTDENPANEKGDSVKSETNMVATQPAVEKKESTVSTLSSTEKELCEKLDLTEEQYKQIKRAIISQSLAHGLLDKESMGSQKRAMVKLDAERKGHVIDFMLRAGWVSSKAAPALRQASSNVGR